MRMKWVWIVIAVVRGVPLMFFGAVYAASEVGGEVVVLHRPAPEGIGSSGCVVGRGR